MSPMKGREIVEEFDWLISVGATPLLAAQQLGKRPDSLARMLWRYGRGDLACLLEVHRYDRFAS